MNTFTALKNTPAIPQASVAATEAAASLQRRSRARLPTEAGEFQISVYSDLISGIEHVALHRGVLEGEAAVLVRVHSECATGDLFGSLRCDCRAQLVWAQTRIAQAPAGVLVYLRGHEGRGIGLAQKIEAYRLQEAGLDTVDANQALGLPVDARHYGAAAAILRDLGVRRVHLMTNNPDKLQALRDLGVDVVTRVPHEVASGPHNRAYLATKRARLGHALTDGQTGP